MEFDAIAAVIVGGTSFERGNGWLPGTLLGVLTVGVLKNGLNVMEVQNAAAGREHRAAGDRRVADRFDPGAPVSPRAAPIPAGARCPPI